MAVPFASLSMRRRRTRPRGAAEAAFQRIQQINDSMTDFDSDSELSRLSQTSGQGGRWRSAPICGCARSSAPAPWSACRCRATRARPGQRYRWRPDPAGVAASRGWTRAASQSRSGLKRQLRAGLAWAPPLDQVRNTRRTSLWVSLSRASSAEKSGASPARAITRSRSSPAVSGLNRSLTHSRRIWVRS